MRKHEFEKGDLVRMPLHIRQSVYHSYGKNAECYQFGVVIRVIVSGTWCVAEVFWPELAESIHHYFEHLVRIK